MADYILLILVLLSLIWLAFTVRTSSSNTSNRLFFWLLVTIQFWMVCNFFEAEVTSQQSLSILFKLDFACAAWIAYFFLRFCIEFPVKSNLKLPQWILTFLTTFISGASIGPFVVRDAKIGGGELQPSFSTGPIFWIYAPIVCGFIFSGIYLTYRKMKKLSGLPQAQASYVLLGLTISGAIAVVVNLMLASIFPISVTVSRLGIYSLLALAWLPGYAILRYRLLDIRILLQETTAYLLTSGAVGVVATFAILFLTRDPYVVIFVFIASLIIPYLQSRSLKWIDSLKIKRGMVDASSIAKVNSLSDRIKEAGYRISDLAETVVQMVCDEFPIKNCSLYVMDYDTRNLVLESKIGSTSVLTSFSSDHPLVGYLEQKREIVFRDEILNNGSLNNASVIEAIDSLNCDVLAPLMVLNQLAGLLVLGPKRDRKAFYENDAYKLKPIVDETATALRYVLAVSLKANETIKWAHSLHQSLKPLTVGFDFLSRRAMVNGSDASLDAVIPRIQGSIKRLGEFLRFLLQDSRLSEEALRNKYSLLPLDIKKVIDAGLYMHRLTIESKQIKVVEEVAPPKSAVRGHERDLTSVFEILTTNALRYTPEQGNISVIGKNSDDKYMVEFFNNGPTIAPENLQAIFSDRFQVKDGKQGMEGFGLANASRILQMHRGRIWAENSADMAGVKFILELPREAA